MWKLSKVFHKCVYEGWGTHRQMKLKRGLTNKKMNLSNSGLEDHSFNFKYRTIWNRLQRGEKNPVHCSSFIGSVHCILLLQLSLNYSVLFAMNVSQFFHSQYNTLYSPRHYIHNNTSSRVLTIIFTVQHPAQTLPPHLCFTA